jgi:hypothetical protein
MRSRAADLMGILAGLKFTRRPRLRGGMSFDVGTAAGAVKK